MAAIAAARARRWQEALQLVQGHFGRQQLIQSCEARWGVSLTKVSTESVTHGCPQLKSLAGCLFYVTGADTCRCGVPGVGSGTVWLLGSLCWAPGEFSSFGGEAAAMEGERNSASIRRKAIVFLMAILIPSPFSRDSTLKLKPTSA